MEKTNQDMEEYSHDLVGFLLSIIKDSLQYTEDSTKHSFKVDWVIGIEIACYIYGI